MSSPSFFLVNRKNRRQSLRFLTAVSLRSAYDLHSYFLLRSAEDFSALLRFCYSWFRMSATSEWISLSI